jgi:hypothetical protein
VELFVSPLDAGWHRGDAQLNTPFNADVVPGSRKDDSGRQNLCLDQKWYALCTQFIYTLLWLGSW